MRFIACFLILNLFVGKVTSNENEVYEIVKTTIDKAMNRQQIPGCAIAVVYKGTPYLFNFGHANFTTKQPMLSDTIFKIASITKTFTATALSIEVINKKMSLSDPISLYIPSLKNSKNHNAQIKLLDLATHTSSLPRTYPANHKENTTIEELHSYLRDLRPKSGIGTKYSYSNFGFGLLGEIIAQVNGTTYEKMIRNLVLNPLKMNSTFIEIPLNKKDNLAKGYSLIGHVLRESTEKNFLPGSGGLYSTASDMLKFLQANMGLLGPDSIIEAMKFAQKEYFKVNNELSMGLAWQRFSTKSDTLIIDKNGVLPGFSTYIGFIPGKDVGIVILFNKSKSHATVIGRHILLKLIEEKTEETKK